MLTLRIPLYLRCDRHTQSRRDRRARVPGAARRDVRRRARRRDAGLHLLLDGHGRRQLGQPDREHGRRARRPRLRRQHPDARQPLRLRRHGLAHGGRPLGGHARGDEDGLRRDGARLGDLDPRRRDARPSVLRSLARRRLVAVQALGRRRRARRDAVRERIPGAHGGRIAGARALVQVRRELRAFSAGGWWGWAQFNRRALTAARAEAASRNPTLDLKGARAIAYCP